MKTSMLDKSVTLNFSLRKMKNLIIIIFGIAFSIWIYLFFSKGYEHLLGGAVYKNSPFLSYIPPSCYGYIQLTYGRQRYITKNTSAGLIDGIFLRDRVIENIVISNDLGGSKHLECLGYAVLAGLHSPIAGHSNFINRWLDAKGDPVFSIHVEYHQTLDDIGFTIKQEISK